MPSESGTAFHGTCMKAGEGSKDNQKHIASCEARVERGLGHCYPPQHPAEPPRHSSPSLGNTQPHYPGNTFVSLDPEFGLFSWEPDALAASPVLQGRSRLAWCLSAMLLFVALLFLRAVFENPAAMAGPPSQGTTGSGVAMPRNPSATYFPASGPVIPAVNAHAPTEGIAKAEPNVQLLGILAGFALLLLVAAFAIHMTPPHQDAEGSMGLQMMEGCFGDASDIEGGESANANASPVSLRSEMAMATHASRACQWF